MFNEKIPFYSIHINTRSLFHTRTACRTDGAIVIGNTDKAWIYTADGKHVEFVKNPAQVAVAEGVYLVKMQNGNVIRSAEVLVK